MGRLLGGRRVGRSGFVSMVNKFYGGGINRVSSVTGGLREQLGGVVNGIPFGKGFMRTSRILAFGSAEDAPALLAMTGYHFFSVLLVMSSSKGNFSRLLGHVQEPVRTISDSRDRRSLCLRYSVERNVQSLTGGGDLGCADNVVGFSLLRSFPRCCGKRVRGKCIHRTLLSLSRVMLCCVSGCPHSRLYGERTCERVTRCLVGARCGVRGFTRNPGKFQRWRVWT